MRKDAQDQLTMVSRVVSFLTENTTEIGVSEVAGEQATLVATQFAQLSGEQGKAARRTKALTAEGKQAKANLLDLLPALLGPLGRVAARLHDDDLLAAVTLSGKQLRRLRPLALLAVANSVLGSAARADVTPELTKQGLTDKTLKPLHTALAAFRTAQPAPRQTIDQRVLANAAAGTQLDALMDAVRELDQDMKAFKLLNRPIYDGYVQMRKIINSGGGKAGDAVDTGAAPVA